MKPSRARGASIEREAVIAELAPGGDGVAHVDIDGERRAVFVRGVAPDDRVRLSIDLGSRPARGRVLEILAAGPDRVTPPCAVAATCGGCDWMHVSPDAQARALEAQVRAALPEAWRGTSIALHRETRALGYRARARVHVETTGHGVQVGMHEASTHAPVPVDVCVVLDARIEAARAKIGGWLEGSRGRGDAQIALGAFADPTDATSARRPVIELQWNGEIAPSAFARLEQAVASGEIAGAGVTLGGATRPAIIGDPTPWMVGADDKPLRLAPGGFGQASEAMNRALARRVAELARDALPDSAPSRKTVELFAGAGNLTVLLAAIADVTAVESGRASCEAARQNLGARGAKARVIEDDAMGYAWASSTRLLVLDPPRTGAREVATRLAASPVRHVIYVSCDPQTLGRDLAIVGAAGYAPRAIETFAMFPQTSHVETVVALERRRG